MIFVCFVSLILFTSSHQASLNLEEGEICLEARDGKWTCTVEYDCPHIDQSAVRPAICSYRHTTPIVCCPFVAKKRSPAELACERFEKLRCANEKELSFEPLVIGGFASKSKSRPEAALLGSGRRDRIKWICAGSLISEKWVLTAAHCASPIINKKGIRWVRLGELDKSTSEDDARPKDRTVIRTVLHPEFNPPAVYHDIALLEMDSPVAFSEYIAPICLHTAFHIPHVKATVIGWGSSRAGERLSQKLLEVEITLVDNDECSKIYSADNKLIPQGIVEKSMICAGEKEGGKDACQGDSGGPFIIQLPGRCINTQIGIVSFGKGCGLANAPGVYTRVSSYVPWIESILWPDSIDAPGNETLISTHSPDLDKMLLNETQATHRPDLDITLHNETQTTTERPNLM